jgi:hypothetical protein
MHVRSSGYPIEITGERDSLAINFDLSECTHEITCTMDVPMSNAHPRQEEFKFICRFSISRGWAEEASCLEAVNSHMHLPIFS